MVNKTRMVWCHITDSLTMTVPPFRMVVVGAFLHDSGEGFRHCVHPVVAVKTELRRSYCKRIGAAAGEYDNIARLSEEWLVEHGWRFDQQTTNFDVVVLDTEDGEVIDYATIQNVEGWKALRLIAAPWPPEEDMARTRSIAVGLAANQRAAADPEALARPLSPGAPSGPPAGPNH